MRRSQFGLLIVIAVAGLLIAPGCQVIQPIGSLTVVSINGGNTLRSDLSDFYVYFDKLDSDYVTLFEVEPDSVKVEMTYAEIGAGLPTWRTPVAIVTQASVKFTSKNISGEDVPYEVAKIGLREAIPSDPTGKKITTFYMTPISASWKDKVFADWRAEDDPYQIDIVDLADAVVTFTGYDSVLNRQLSTSGTFQVEFGNIYDDPSRFGK
jgi:hypothetical protein